MISRRAVETFFSRDLVNYLPHLSIDCVVFGFHGTDLKVLLLNWRNSRLWTLPGGYIRRRESLDAAAHRILRDRTGLPPVHLRQFHAFGGLRRKEREIRLLFAKAGVAVPADAWPLQRVVSIGYYALLDFWKARPRTDYISVAATWYPVNDLPALAFDHGDIIRRAFEALRDDIESPAAAATLLPDSFTMPELQRLHEAILGAPLDRRNFQKRMLQRGGLERLPHRRTGGAHRAPFLYRFVADGPWAGPAGSLRQRE